MKKEARKSFTIESTLYNIMYFILQEISAEQPAVLLLLFLSF